MDLSALLASWNNKVEGKPNNYSENLDHRFHKNEIPVFGLLSKDDHLHCSIITAPVPCGTWRHSGQQS